jgi:hypothetical protein
MYSHELALVIGHVEMERVARRDQLEQKESHDRFLF